MNSKAIFQELLSLLHLSQDLVSRRLIGRHPKHNGIFGLSDSHSIAHRLRCQTMVQPLLGLNQTLYIATDVRRPHRNKYLSRFFKTFPCTFILEDFQDIPAFKDLKQLRNEEDGIKIGGFMLPLLEAEVASRG